MKKIGLFLTFSILVMAMGCNSAGDSGNSGPREVLTKFLQALGKKDIEEAKKYVTKDSEPFMNMIQTGMSMAGDISNQVYQNEDPVYGDPMIEGDRATVQVSSKNSEEKRNFILKKENGDWKVSFDIATVMQMGRDKMKNNGLEGSPEDMMGSKEDIENAMNSFKNLSKEDMEKATRAMDSLQKVFKDFNHIFPSIINHSWFRK